ncbi:carboxylesterase family protein [Pontibacter sp. G13]|uniref:carboxylesterase/lipase family protein n=1 Tax=Pontibacter sp. G13 TaxID=3074898 RepID=UPI00288B7A99|nr:carboxylesterase family protein [Pontibacter sp. G13]WNJ16287.1 carboxylesterase family protein [Pontibacter sp. G13]
MIRSSRAGGKSPVRKTKVQVPSGVLQGYDWGAGVRFAAIPYAEAPVGPLRFAPPQSPKPWKGVRDATQFGPIQPQMPSRFSGFLGLDRQRQSEDSLFLNIFTPQPDHAKRPVMVWIHGGRFASGSGSFHLFDGQHLAEVGDMVVVTLNYRLGVRGSLRLDGHASTERNGLNDLVQALRWIRANIEQFGGNAEDVCIAGQGAGAIAAVSLMAYPSAEGLFSKAILQSGSFYHLKGVKYAESISNRFMELAKAQSLEELNKKDICHLLHAQSELLAQCDDFDEPFQPTGDGVHLPINLWDAARGGKLAKVPILIGCNHHDYRPFLHTIDPAKLPHSSVALRELLDQRIAPGAGEEIFYQYRKGSCPEIYGKVLQDLRFEVPAHELAGALSRHQPVYMYRFDWVSPVKDLEMGAGHFVDLPFSFGNLHSPSTPYLLGDNPPQQMADMMSRAWAQFVRSGNPNHEGLPDWPTYHLRKRATQILDLKPHVVDDPARSHRLFWADVLPWGQMFH